MYTYRFHIALCSFLFGVGVETLAPVTFPTITWLFLLLGALGVFLYTKQPVSEFARTIFVGICCAMFLLGLLRVEIASWSLGISPLETTVGKEILAEGLVVAEPDVRERTQHLKVKIGEDVVRVSADKYISVSYGDTVRVVGVLERPENFTSDLGREFDYEHYLLAQGIEYIVSFAEVSIVSQGNGNPVFVRLFQIKNWLLEGINFVLNEPESGLGAGLLLGVKQALGDELEKDFRSAGIIHIVVLSGYNIMLIVSFVMFGLSFVLRKRLRIIIGLIAITCFAIVVGLSATVVRASIMAGLLLVAQALGRTYDVSRALLFAAVVMVVIQPYLLLYDIGFQLSFMATLGLVLLIPRFEALLAEESGSITIREYLLSTVATQIAVMPLLLYYIGEISVVSIAVNVLVLPIVPFAMLTTFLAGAFWYISPLVALSIGILAHYSLSYIIAVATWFASLSYAAVGVPAFSGVWVFAMYGVMFVGYGYVVRGKQNDCDKWVVEEETKEAGELRSPASDHIPVLFR